MALVSFGPFAANMDDQDDYGIPALRAIMDDLFAGRISLGTVNSAMVEFVTPSGKMTMFGTFNLGSSAGLMNSTVARMLMTTSGGTTIADIAQINMRLSEALADASDATIFRGQDSMTGTGGADTLVGYAGNDTLVGGAGNDQLRGMLGNDTYRLDNTGDAVVELLNQGTDTIEFAGDYSLLNLEHVENLTLLGSGDYDATGNVLRNLLVGNGGNNVLDGGMLGDTMRGGLGNDSYHVQDGFDLVVELANQGIDTVIAQDSYTLPLNVENLEFLVFLSGDNPNNSNGTGNALANRLGGTDGNNLLNGLAGNDTYVGSNGNDTYVLTEAGDSVDGSGGDGGIDTVRVALAGSAYLDLSDKPYLENVVLTGTGIANLTGNASNNALTGNASANRLDGGAGADTMTGLAGNDTYVVDDSADVIVDSAGVDTVESNASYTLATGLENLTLTGSGNIDGTGNAGANVMRGNAGLNVLAGLAGNDTYHVQNPADQVVETLNAGVDVVFATLAGGQTYALGDNVESLALLGGANAGAIGNALANTLTGDAGNNTLDGGGGKDVMAGGAGNDTYVVDVAGEVVTEALNAGSDTVHSAITYVLGANVENLVLLDGYGNLNGTGNTLANILTGNNGDNLLSGLAGADTYLASAGNDTYLIADAGDLVDASGGDAGSDTVRVSVAGSAYLDLSDKAWLENAVFLGAGTATLRGNEADNALTGNASANTLDGGAGADTMTGLAGNDTYVVDDSADVIVDSAGVDTVESNASYTLAAGLENLTLTGGGNIDGTGNAGANVLRGNAGLNVLAGLAGNDTYYVHSPADQVVETLNAGVDVVFATLAGGQTYTLGDNVESLTLLGGANAGAIGNALVNTLTGDAGNNTLDGGGGKDVMAGGAGNDTYVVDVAGEVVTEALNAGTDTVRSSVTHVLAANVENLELAAGAGNINGTGNAIANVLSGNEGANSLDGGAGDDSLAGGAGADVLRGGLGNDTLRYDGADTLADGGAGRDTLAVASSGVAVNLAGAAAAKFKGFEVVDLTGSGDNSLTIDLAGVLAVTEATRVLRVNGDHGDSVSADGGWVQTATVVADGQVYAQFTKGLATLLVDLDVATEGLGSAGTGSAQQVFAALGGQAKGVYVALADASLAAYDRQYWEFNTINDAGGSGPESALGRTLQHWTPVDLGIEDTFSSLFIDRYAGGGIQAQWDADPVDLPGQPPDEAEFILTNRMDDGFFTFKNGAAFAARSGDSLLIAFRGTNDFGDGEAEFSLDNDQYLALGSHYAYFDAFVDGIDQYLGNSANGIHQVYVTGHSLGGSMAIAFMNEHADNAGLGLSFQAVTFGSPGYGVLPVEDDPRITHVEAAGDVVADLGYQDPGDTIQFVGSQISSFPGTSNHDMGLYLEIARNVDDLNWSLLTRDSFDINVFIGARKNADGSFYVSGGPDLLDLSGQGLHGSELLYGGIGNDTIRSSSVLGGNSDEAIYGGPGRDDLSGGDGEDVFYYGAPTEGGDTIRGFRMVALDGSGEPIGSDEVDLIGIRAAGFGFASNPDDPSRWLEASEFLASSTGVATASTHRFVYRTTTGGLYYDADGNGAGASVLLATIVPESGGVLTRFQIMVFDLDSPATV